MAARVVDLTKVYGSGAAEVRALDGVTLDIGAGEFTAVMGPSGSGKSTLMHCCAALDVPTSGEVFIGDTEIGNLSDKKLTHLRRERIGFVFQSFNLVPTLTAKENILLPLSIAGRKPDSEWYDAVIGTVNLADRLDHRPNQLSGGQQQRVAVARALTSRPDIVFADEPTGNLDSRSGAEVLGLLQQCARSFGQTIVMVTHDPVAAATPTGWSSWPTAASPESSTPRRDEAVQQDADDGTRGLARRRRRLTCSGRAWKSLLGRKMRLLMSTFAIVLGVAFVAGTMIFTDTLNKSFVAIFEQLGRRRRRTPAGEADNQDTQTTLTMPGEPGPEARPGARGRARRRQRDHLRAVRDRQEQQGGRRARAPRASASTRTTPRPPTAVEPLQVVQGDSAHGPDEVVIDVATVDRGATTSARRSSWSAPAVRRSCNRAGRARRLPRSGGSLNGATMTVFDTASGPEALPRRQGRLQRRLGDREATGSPRRSCAKAVPKVLPEGYEAVTGDKAADQAASELLDEIRFLTVFLLVFARPRSSSGCS